MQTIESVQQLISQGHSDTCFYNTSLMMPTYSRAVSSSPSSLLMFTKRNLRPVMRSVDIGISSNSSWFILRRLSNPHPFDFRSLWLLCLDSTFRLLMFAKRTCNQPNHWWAIYSSRTQSLSLSWTHLNILSLFDLFVWVWWPIARNLGRRLP